MSLKIKRSLLKLSGLVFSGMLMFNAQAGMLVNTLVPTSTGTDIDSSDINVNYTVDSNGVGTLNADGFANGIEEPTSPNSTYTLITNGEFNLVDVSINTLTNEASGFLDISGQFTSAITGVTYSNSLLTASLAQVAGVDMAINFIFNVTGGSAAALFGDTVGVILNNAANGSMVAFNAAFSSNGNAYSDTFSTVVVPEPSPLALLLFGLVALGLRKKTQA